jgi:ABC-type amino acid transport system, permease component
MVHSGINVLFEGTNFSRLLGGMWTTFKIAAIAIVIGLIIGVILGVLRTFHNPILRTF